MGGGWLSMGWNCGGRSYTAGWQSDVNWEWVSKECLSEAKLWGESLWIAKMQWLVSVCVHIPEKRSISIIMGLFYMCYAIGTFEGKFSFGGGGGTEIRYLSTALVVIFWRTRKWSRGVCDLVWLAKRARWRAMCEEGAAYCDWVTCQWMSFFGLALSGGESDGNSGQNCASTVSVSVKRIYESTQTRARVS